MPTIVGASTYAIGRVFLRHFQEGGAITDISAERMKGYYAEQREAGKKVVASVKSKSTSGRPRRRLRPRKRQRPNGFHAAWDPQRIAFCLN